ncbi:PREDICTED: uncharacterized protein LOC108547226 [Eufriesea mexicana]|uniref:uncharacterized protein LOC108547226 n=1 Tax=Eufriesea mexicana TaxID=516756 RepID=UPI00083C54D9|nr:PREDICTED: uncharacterized protein LOC108547226 [Eufriesea mexicana]
MVQQSKINKDEENPAITVLRYCMSAAVAGSILDMGNHVMRGAEFNTNATVGKMIRGSFLGGRLGLFYFGGTYLSSQIRKKDDFFNNIIGACTTIPLLRQYMALHYTYPIMVAVIGTIIAWKSLHIGPSEDIGQLSYYGREIDIETMLRKPPGEPFVKHTPNSFF